MAFPAGITPKFVTLGIASFFSGETADGTVTVTAPANVVHTPTNTPIFSSRITRPFINGTVRIPLVPSDAPGLNRADWTYRLTVTITGAVVQPDPVDFVLLTGGPDEVDLDGLLTAPSSIGTPISVDAVPYPAGGTDGQSIVKAGSGAAWATTFSIGQVPDASITDKGLVRLAGELGGTADAPTVPGLAGKADATALTAGLAGKADATALSAVSAQMVPKYQPSTLYTAGDVVLNPSNKLATRKVTGISSPTYTASEWTPVTVQTADQSPRSVTEDKLSVPAEGALGWVLTYDPAQPGQMKWFPPSAGPVTGPVMTPNDPAAATANTNAWKAYVASNTRGPLLSIDTPGTYYVNDALDCTNATNYIRELYRGAGVDICQLKTVVNSATDGRAYGPWFKGSLETVSGTPVVRFFSADVPRGSRTITLDNVTGLYGEGPDEAAGTPARDMLHPGSLLYLFSDDYIHDGGKYRNCALVRVITLAGNVVTIDAPLYRNWTTAKNAAAVVVNPHPPVLVHGPGRIYHNDPWGNDTFYGALLRFEFCDTPVVRDVNLGPGPGNGVELFSCLNADVAPNTQFLISDDAQGNDTVGYETWHPNNLIKREHYGYGVIQGGANRNAQIGGSAHHVRHAHTTGASPDTVGVAGLKAAVIASGRPNAASSNPGNCGDPTCWEVAIRTIGTWQQNIDTHEAGNRGTIRLLSAGGGTWDDTTEEATKSGVVIRCNEVTVSGDTGGSMEYSAYCDHGALVNPEFGEVVFRDLRIGPSNEAIRFNPGPGSRLRIDDVSAYGCKQFLYVRTANPFTVVGDRNYVDGSAVAESTSKRILWFDAVVTANLISLGLDWTGYATAVAYNGSGMTQDSVRLRQRTDRQPTVIVYNGTAWPTARPILPAGDVKLVSPVAGIAAPSWLLRGDRYTVAG